MQSGGKIGNETIRNMKLGIPEHHYDLMSRDNLLVRLCGNDPFGNFVNWFELILM